MIDMSKSIATIINFILLLAVVTYFLFKPVQKILNSREQDISNRIKKTKHDEETVEALKTENAQLLRESKEKGRAIVEEYKIKAEKVSDEIINDAKKEASQIEERSKNEIRLEREKASDEMKRQIIDLSLLMSSKALGENIDEEKHKQLIKEFITKVGI